MFGSVVMVKVRQAMVMVRISLQGINVSLCKSQETLTNFSGRYYFDITSFPNSLSKHNQGSHSIRYTELSVFFTPGFLPVMLLL